MRVINTEQRDSVYYTVRHGLINYQVYADTEVLRCGPTSYIRAKQQFCDVYEPVMQQVLQTVLDYERDTTIEIDPVICQLYRVKVDNVWCEVTVKEGSFIKCGPCVYDMRTGIYSGEAHDPRAAHAVQTITTRLLNSRQAELQLALQECKVKLIVRGLVTEADTIEVHTTWPQ